MFLTHHICCQLCMPISAVCIPGSACRSINTSSTAGQSCSKGETPEQGGWRAPDQVLVRALPGWEALEADALAFLALAEERLLLALEPPAATPAQPLSAAMLQARSVPPGGPWHADEGSGARGTAHVGLRTHVAAIFHFKFIVEQFKQ